MTVINSVGVVREGQAMESFCIELGRYFQRARFMGPTTRGLAFATPAFGVHTGHSVVPEPLDMCLCLVYIAAPPTKERRHTTSPPPAFLHVRA